MTKTVDRAQMPVLPPVIPGLGLALGFALQFVWPLGFLPHAGYWLGGISFAVAMALALAAALRMKRAQTSVDARKSTTRIVTDGVFAHTRNPIYLAMVICVLAAACIANSLWLLLLAAPVGYALQRLAMEPEERYLEAKFGKEYLDYKARVRRWV